MHLAAGWAARRGRALHAFIVDHGLQPGSAAAAAGAAAQARALGVPARILRWEGEKPRAGVQQAAREARLRLLAQACREAGAEALLLAHTLDDQAETVWQRAGAGSAWRGLAAMRAEAPAPLWPDMGAVRGRPLTVLRPLLETRRAELREFLISVGAEWTEDPANADPRYGRVRARAALAALGDDAAVRLAGIAARAGALADAEDAAARALLVHVAAPHDGTLRIAHAALDAPGAARLIQAALAAAAGAARPPSPEAVERLMDKVRAGRGATLGGATVLPRAHALVICRDAGAALGRAGVPAPEPLPLTPGADAIWDGRWAVRAHAPDLCIAPLGMAWKGLKERAKAQLAEIPAAARASLPALWRGGRLAEALPGAEAAGLASLRPLAAGRLRRLLFTKFPWFDEEYAEIFCGPGGDAPSQAPHGINRQANLTDRCR